MLQGRLFPHDERRQCLLVGGEMMIKKCEADFLASLSNRAHRGYERKAWHLWR